MLVLLIFGAPTSQVKTYHCQLIATRELNKGMIVVISGWSMQITTKRRLS